MDISISPSDLAMYVKNQLNYIFPDNSPVTVFNLKKGVKNALERVEFCFSHLRGRYFWKNGKVFFNHLHSDQYSMFLYFLSNSLFRQKNTTSICEKIFYLNKCMHGIDCFYSVKLPSIFVFVHPIGTILGNQATFSDYLLISQNCTIGDNYDNNYPVLGKGVALYAGAKVIGDCYIGDNCEISSDASVYKSKIESNCVVFGKYPYNVIKTHNKSIIEKHFLP